MAAKPAPLIREDVPGKGRRRMVMGEGLGGEGRTSRGRVRKEVKIWQNNF